jgi:hypothetical protein
MCEFTSLKWIKLIWPSEWPIKMFTDGIWKYVLWKLYKDIVYKQYLWKTQENEGIYINNNIINTNYIVGTINFEIKLNRDNKYYNDYYFSYNDIVINLWTKCTTDSFLEIIEDSELPMKIKIWGILNWKVIWLWIDILIIKIKDTVEELIKEILEEKWFNPTDNEIEEIVKNSAFNPENEWKWILNPVYKTEWRIVKKVKVSTTYFWVWKKEVKIEDVD